MSLWVTIAATMVVFATMCAVRPKVWGLAVILLPYLILLGVVATVWNTAGPALVTEADRCKLCVAFGTQVADFAPGIKKGQIGGWKTVVFANKTRMIACFLPKFEGMVGFLGHPGFIAPPAVAVRELGRPQGDAGWYA